MRFHWFEWPPFPMQETIAVVSTPFGEGAIAMLRISGPEAFEIADRFFRSSRGSVAAIPPRMAQFGRVVDATGRVLDEVVLTPFHPPASYTGEAMVEITCHGGILITRRLLDLLLEHGARLARGGEFTQRAFLNGRMDLTQAEAVMDLIKAQTDLALRAATEQLEGRLGEQATQLREALLELLAHIEAYIDFPEEDIDPETGNALITRLSDAEANIARLLSTADQGRVLREGLRTVIYGAPNVGKSSLLNRLLGYERAIVSDLPGTTRDSIEEVINLHGIPVRLVDTAGVRTSEDLIEREGIARTLQHLERADLVLHLMDGSRPRPTQEPDLGHLLVLNKTDLGEDPSWHGVDAVRLSCNTGDGMERLADAVFDRAMGKGAVSSDFTVAINARHQACLKAAQSHLATAHAGLKSGLSAEWIAIDVREGLDAIGEIVGRVDTEDLLGKIFSTFCLGK